MVKDKGVTVGLLWHSLVSGNLGVGALTEANLSIVTAAATKQGLNVRFLILGISDEGIPALSREIAMSGNSIECRRVRVFKRAFKRDVAECDLVLDIGAGDSFADIYGFKRFFFYWLSKCLVSFSGTPLVLAPQTIGPFDGVFARYMARQALRRCEVVFSRDSMSSDYLRELGIVGNAAEAIDVAFKLPFLATTHGGDDRVNVGLNVSGLLYNGGYTGDNQFGLTVDYPKVIREILGQLADRKNVVVHLVGHVIEPEMPIEDDIAVSKMLADEFDNVIVAPSFKRPSVAKSYIAGLDFFAGARMHSCIAAFSSGVPVVPMAYSRKFNGLFDSLGYKHVADMKKLNNEAVVAAVVNGFDCRSELKDSVLRGNGLAAEKIGSYERYLEAWFSEF